MAVGRKIAFSVLRKAGCYLTGAASGVSRYIPSMEKVEQYRVTPN